MKYIPILFSGPMVSAILDGRKTMTRRVVKPQPDDDGLWNDTKYPRSLQSQLKGWNGTVEANGESKEFQCKYGEPGDILWVRETWRAHEQDFGSPRYEYKATETINLTDKWKPSLFMPKEACRIFLEVTNVRVEMLQDIKSEDAVKEGIACVTKDGGRTYKFGIPDADGYPGSGEIGWKWQDWQPTPTEAFQHLWQKINGVESWNINPWIWVINFKRVERPADFKT